MTKSMYLKLGIILGIISPIAQVILSRNTWQYSETKLIMYTAIIISVLQIGCYLIAYSKEKFQYAASMAGVLLFFIFAGLFIYLDRTTGGGVIPSGSTIFLWIPQAWALKSFAKA